MRYEASTVENKAVSGLLAKQELEVGLDAPTPRARTFFSKQGMPLVEDWAVIVREWAATRAVVVNARKKEEHPEGPDYSVDLCFAIGGDIQQCCYEAGYDVSHWQASSPEHYEWFHETLLKPNSYVTLFYDAGASEARLFGAMEPFSQCSLAELLDMARAAPSDDEQNSYCLAMVDLLQDISDQQGPRLKQAMRGFAAELDARDDVFYWVGGLAQRIRLGKPVLNYFETLAREFVEEAALVWAAK